MNHHWTHQFVFVVLAGHQMTMASSFRPLGDLPGGDFRSVARDVSADGSVVVGHSDSALVDPGFGREAFRWTRRDGMIALGDLPGGSFSSGALAISNDGKVVVGSGTSGRLGREAFRWTEGTGMVGLGELPGGHVGSTAHGVSADGSVIVGTSGSVFSGTVLDDEAFRWTSGTGMTGLGDLEGGDPFSEGADVSADGSIVVGLSESALGIEAYRWTSQGGMTGLGDLPGGLFGSGAVTSDGSVIVGTSGSASGPEAYRWTAGTGMVGLGDLPGGQFSSSATDVSDDGSIVVGRSRVGRFSNQDAAFVWDEVHGMRSIQELLIDAGIDLTGWSLTGASGISSDGFVIVGTGLNPDGKTEAWWADLKGVPGFVPEPASFTVFACGGLILDLRRRRS